MRRIFTVVCLGIVALFPTWAAAETRQGVDRPNVLLVVSDDHGLDAAGCFGNDVIETPNLDKLAQEGTIFTRAYCTSPSCSACRSVIMTGRYNHATAHYGHAHGYHHFSTYDHEKSLPVYLSEAGYRTARIGKYHLAPDSVYRFDTELKADPRNTVEMAVACEDFIRSEDESPFFLYFCTDDPHRGAPFKGETPDAPNSFGNKVGGYPGVQTKRYRPEDVIVPPFLPDSPQCRAELAEYYQSVSRVDQGLGRLLDILKQSGQYDRTVIVYISDNGIAFPGAKTTTYEPGIKLPCIVKVPGQQRSNIKCDALVNWADLAPTILDWAGVSTEGKKLHGRSIRKIIEDPHPDGWDTTYASHTFHEITMYYPMRVVIERRYKLIWNIAYKLDFPFASDLWQSSTWQEVHRNEKEYFGSRRVEDYLHRAQFELYDLEADPEELNNLAGQSEHQELLERLKQKLREFQAKTEDPWIITWDNDDVFGGSGVNL